MRVDVSVAGSTMQLTPTARYWPLFWPDTYVRVHRKLGF